MKLAFKLMEDAGIPQERAKPEGMSLHDIAGTGAYELLICSWLETFKGETFHESVESELNHVWVAQVLWRKLSWMALKLRNL